MSVEWLTEGRQFRLCLANTTSILYAYRHDDGSVQLHYGDLPPIDLRPDEVRDLGQALLQLSA